MAFRMGGLFIQARVENGLGTFEIGQNNAFVNSLNGATITMRSGGSSSIDLSFAPTFSQAVEIIESGFLGYGFPLQSQGKGSKGSTMINGFATPIENTGISSATSFLTGEKNKSASLAIRIGYGDLGAERNVAMTPWIFGNIQAPDLSFGEEISIGMKAESLGMVLANSDTIRTFEATSLGQIVKEILKKDCNADVEFSSESQQRADSLKITTTQADNSQAFLKNLLEQYNFKFYDSGGTEDDPTQRVMITDLASISNGKPKLTLSMYGQINISQKIYPMESFNTRIDHLFIAGATSGQATTNLKTSDKLIKKKTYGVDDYKKNIKAKGDTIGGKLSVGKPTKGGITDGPPNSFDKLKAGKRKTTILRDDLDVEQNKAVESETMDKMDGSFSMTVTCPLIPEIVPDILIRVQIHTGNPNRPIFKTISGVYRVTEVKHSVSDNGGTTEVELLRGVGDTPIDKANVSKVNDNIKISTGEVQPTLGSLIGGVIA